MSLKRAVSGIYRVRRGMNDRMIRKRQTLQRLGIMVYTYFNRIVRIETNRMSGYTSVVCQKWLLISGVEMLDRLGVENDGRRLGSSSTGHGDDH